MTRYALTEAYSEIYDHRKAEDLFDNLRFVDYMLDEDIEEVIESLVWEFRDYGNTLDEAFKMIDYAVTVPVLYESYDELISDVLCEATVTRSRAERITSSDDRPTPSGSTSSRVTVGRGQWSDAGRRAADRASRLSTANRSVRSRLDGPMTSVRQAMAGAKGGMGRAVKDIGGAIAKTPGLAAKAAEKGKSLLASLLRRGARAAGRALTSTGRAIEGSGRQAAAATPTTRTARVGRTTVTTTTEPGGAKRQAVGRAIRRVGAALQRGRKGTGMSRADYDQRKADREASAKAAVGDAFAKPKALPPATSRPALPAARPETETRRAATQRKPPSSERRFPTEPSGQTTLFTGPVKGKSVGIDTKVPPGGRRKFGRTRKPKPTERTRQTFLRLGEEIDMNLALQNLIQDIISEGYATNVDDAFELIGELDESTLSEILQEYLVD